MGMASIKKAILDHARELMELNKVKKTHQYTWEEALDVARYDLYYCNSDEDSKKYLVNETMSDLVTEEEADLLFRKARKTKKQNLLTAEQEKYNKEVQTKTKEGRLNYLLSEIKKRPELFGTTFEYTNSYIKGIAPECGLPYTIRISKHKEQKVFTNTKDRKKNLGDITPAETRAMSLGYMLATCPDKELFEAVSYNLSSFGYVNRDAKFPYGSIKITQHKKKED